MAYTGKDVARLIKTSRTCDGCDLCCTACGVEVLDKPPGVRCKHLCGSPGKNCAIYDERPEDCHEFLCLWRGSDKLLPASFFPAKCGFVVVLSDFSSFPFIFTVHPDPDRPDAWRGLQYRSMFSTLAKKFNAIVVIGQAHLACNIFSPSGREFSIEKYPILFAEGGKRIGLPTTEFDPWRPTLEDVGRLLWGT